MRKTLFAVLGVCIGVSVSLRAGGATQDSAIPTRLTLDEAIRLADARNPTLALARDRVAIAESAVVTARTRPNPTLEVSSEGLGSGSQPGIGRFDRQELVVRLDQVFEPGARRQLRTDLAGRSADVTRAEAGDLRRLVASEVMRTYFQIAFARAEVETAHLAMEEIDKVLALNRIRFDQGEISGGELRRLEVERMRFVDDLLAADLSLQNARSGLLALIGADRLDLPVEPVDPLVLPAGAAQPLPDATALRARALEQRPDLEAARRERARAASDARLQQALRVPPLVAGAGYHRDSGEGGLALSLSVPLPFFDRNAGEIARADAERRLAEHRVTVVESRVALEVQQAVNNADASRRRIEYVEREYLKNAQEARDIVLAAYRAGAADLVDFLDAERALREARRIANRAWFEHRVNLVQLEAVSGGIDGRPSGQMAPSGGSAQ